MTGDSLNCNGAGQTSDRRRYQFSIHGESTVRPRTRRIEPSQARGEKSGNPSRSKMIPPYVAIDLDNFNLRDFAIPERLYSVFCILRREGGHGAGADGITYSDFDNSEIYAALRDISRKLIDHDYTPHETRLVRIPKGDGRYRELQLYCILDRVIAKALQLALDAYWRSHLPRLGKSVIDLYATMQSLMRQFDAKFLTVSDVRDCFPSAPIDVVLECHRRHISHVDLLWLIETIVRGHDGLRHTIGLYQGSPYSPVAMELLLHTYLDTRFGTEFREIPFLLRYVDNLNIICRNEREGQETLRFCKSVLSDLGLNLKPERPPMDAPMDLRTQHPNRKVLGLNPSWKDGRLHVTIPETAYDNLRTKIAQSVAQFNPSEMAKTIAKEWLENKGSALTNAAIPATVDRVISILKECGFNEMNATTFREPCLLAHCKWLRLTEP